MTVLVDRASEDQPWVVAGSVVVSGASQDRVYVGNIEFFWEVKANLDHRHVRQLRAAGVRFIQPGIESLSDHVSPTCIHWSDRS